MDMPKLPKNIYALALVLIVVLVTASVALRVRNGDDPLDGLDDIVSGLLGVEDQATIELTVVYEDDTERTFSAVDLSVTSLQITDESGGIVKEIRANVKVKVDWEGTYASQITSGKIQLYHDYTITDPGISPWDPSYDDPWATMDSVVSPVSGMTLKNTHSFTYSNDLPQGSWATIASITYSNLALETWTVTGMNHIQIIANLEVTISFTDGSMDSMEGGGGTIFNLEKGTTPTTSGALTILDVGVAKTVFD